MCVQRASRDVDAWLSSPSSATETTTELAKTDLGTIEAQLAEFAPVAARAARADALLNLEAFIGPRSQTHEVITQHGWAVPFSSHLLQHADY
jgi:hypothetical protein